jgi:signal transduction histidine kinase
MTQTESSSDACRRESTHQIAELTQTIHDLRAELAMHKESGAQISRFANQLRTATDVSKQLSSILDLERLLPEVVSLLRERFELYHVHVYLLDNSGRHLQLCAGSGAVGQQLLARKHEIALDTAHSLVARSAREGYIILVDDVRREPDFLPNPLLPDTRSEMAVPLITGDRVWGVLDVQDNRLHRFDQLDVATFSAISGHIATAIRNAYLFDEQRQAEKALRQYASRLQSLHEIDQAILTAKSPTSIAQGAIQRIRALVPYHRASFIVFDYKHDTAHIFSVTRDETASLIAGQYHLDTHSDLLERLKYGPIYGDLYELPQTLPFWQQLYEGQIGSLLVYPLLAHGELIGTLNLSRPKPEVFDEEDIQIVSEVAAPLAIAMEQARLYEQIQRHAQILEEQNAELEQFAYVASHDLQEPLRIVISYVQLLSRRYEGQLDEDADLFIKYIVEGALRMKDLISGLLDYSRLGRRGQPFAFTACEGVLTRVLANLQVAIEERGAEIRHTPLPVVWGDAMQLGQLFQNLLSNAIKFCDGRPQVDIGARQEGEEWLFWVRDNGIGLDLQYAERIFAIFQRLHTIEEYPGTGIGLAICKKIVERHNGRLWVESETGQGSTFFFTLPARDDMHR